GHSWISAATRGPSARRDASMVYDPASRRVLMVGGYDSGAHGAETWTWDGKEWTRRNDTLVSRYASSLVADAACRCVLLLGGINAGMNAPVADSWRWDGSSWHALAPHPSARSDARMIYDPVTKQV